MYRIPVNKSFAAYRRLPQRLQGAMRTDATKLILDMSARGNYGATREAGWLGISVSPRGPS